MRNVGPVAVVGMLLFLLSCNSSEDDPVRSITVISSTINGGNFSSGIQNVAPEFELSFVFSNALDQAAFETQLSLTGPGQENFLVVYANGGSKAIISADLAYNSSYTLSIGTGVIGKNGESLASPLNYLFSTADDDVIRSQPPCTSTSACLRSVELMGSEGLGTFDFYSNYPIYEENAEWENLTQAVIVVHGASHNPNDYFAYMTSTFQSESWSESTVLIAPFFRSISTGSSEDFYWANTNWRRGQESSNSNKLSSFKAIDYLIDQLANKVRFPFLEKIIVTGHSSGAAFTHVYSGSNESEITYSEIEFDYVIANSQFFYYPNGQRVDESTNLLYTPTGCAGYGIWPLGYSFTPPYLSGLDVATFNTQFVNRRVTYLLGNGNQSDPTLNTVDCENTLQGSSRYNRGENIFRYMELTYPSTHGHTKTIVSGIGHDGQGMYQSSEFKTLLNQLIQ